MPPGPFIVPITIQSVFPVDSGLNTISVIGKQNSGSWEAEQIRLTLIYFNTAYGDAPRSALANAAQTSAMGNATVLSLPAADPNSPTVDRTRLENELKDLKVRLMRLEAMLDR
jgi:hypothetical protein